MSSSQRGSEPTINNARIRVLDWVRRKAQAALDALEAPKAEASLLRPLTPKYNPQEHKVYVEAIEDALTGPNASDIHNIALTGAYGAGKSSVLSEVVRDHPDAVSISLSTLGSDVVVSPEAANKTEAKDGDETGNKRSAKAETPTNRIQKEIVKQLLYQAGPSRLPGSRYRQLGRLRKWRTFWIALSVGLGVALVGYVTTLTDKITHIFVPQVPSPLIPIAIVWAVATAAIFAIIAVLHNRVSIDQLGAASATISLSRKSETFFDEYLDEIVYFFDISKRDIVIFEDIDRFDEPNIFETLRALNTLLNSAKQLHGRNIRFIYAIKDSIFDALSKREATEQVKEDKTRDVDTVAAEIARANRTKFFDLVVPIVPFVTHLSARDLMHGVMDKIEPAVDPAVMDLVAGEMPDMRLIIEARNEYLVFSRVVLTNQDNNGGLDLDPTLLFAMMLYKSTHLSDFEAIRNGESHLDQLYDLRGKLIAQNLNTLNGRAAHLRRQLTLQARLRARTAVLGDQLIDFVMRMAEWAPKPSNGVRPRNPTFAFGGQSYSASQVREPEFWRAYAAEPGSVQASVTSYQQYNVTLTADDMKHFIVPTLPSPAWFDRTADEIKTELEQNRADRSFLAHATMQDLYTQPRFTVETADGTKTFARAAHDLVPSKLARRLIEKGYIDADFTLYTSKYYGNRVSARASNFILHNIDRGLIDTHAPLDAGEVDTILRERNETILTERAVLNIAIVDRLIERGGDLARTFVDRFMNPDEDEIDFLETYLAEGEQKLAFVERLASVWTGVLPFILERVDAVEGAALWLLDAALRGLDDDSEPDVNEGVKLAIDAHYVDLPSLTIDESVPVEAIADTLERADVSIADLSALSPTMRRAIVARSLYPVDRANLLAAVGVEALSLDEIRKKDEHVYEHVLAHIDAYLAALGPEEPTIAGPTDFVVVVNDVAAKALGAIAAVVERAAEECTVTDLNQPSSTTWQALAEGARFPSTFKNIALYVATIGGIDASLGSLLDRAGAISTADEDDQDARRELAITILDARTAIPSQVMRVQLVESLGLEKYLPADRITAERGELVALLIAADVIEDNADSFALTNGLDWPTRERTIAASEEFASFLADSGIRAGEVPRVLASTTIDKDVKDDLALSSAQFVPAADRAGFTAVAEYAVSNGIHIAMAELVRMASARTTPGLVLELLDRFIDSSSVTDLTPVLTALGPNYARMAERTRKQSRIVNSPASQHLARRLHALGTVSTANPAGAELVVYMHR